MIHTMADISDYQLTLDEEELARYSFMAHLARAQ